MDHMGLHQRSKKSVRNSAEPQKRAETKAQKSLNRRRADYSKMVSQNKIGDGHRGPEGYTRPGSNKK